MSEPGQALWDAIVAVGGVPAPDFHQLHPGNQRVWRTVERTIANEALRRAAEVAALEPDFSMKTEYAMGYERGRNEAATKVRALIKEPGHE